MVVRRRRDLSFELLLAADRHGEVVAGLGAEAAMAFKRRIERDGAERARHHEIAVGLEARRQRPFHLLVGEDVDVGIDHEHVLDVGERAERRRDGVARLAGYTLAYGDAYIVDTAGRRRRI